MYVYEHGNKKYIFINGKDYFLIRGYQNSRGNLIFIQVTGKTPLNKEDLHNNTWGIVRTKMGKQRVWTAFNKTYFKYNQEKDERKMVFVGATSQGSCYLALKWINDNFNQKQNQESLLRLAEQYSKKELSNYSFNLLEDKGNTKEKAVLLEITSRFDEHRAERILKGG